MSLSHDRSPNRWGTGKLVGLILAGACAGGIAVTAIGAAASTSSSAPGTSSAAASPAPNQQSTPVRGDEKAVSASLAATLKAAALKAVPGGTVYRVETDSGDAVYEAHMTKSDGSLVTVKFDKNLAVTKVEDGMGAGDPAANGGPPR